MPKTLRTIIGIGCLTMALGGRLEAEDLPTPTVAPDNARLVLLDRFPEANSKYSPRRTHDIRIYLPADYATSKQKYPVIYFHDGDQVFAADFPGKLKLDGLFHDLVCDRMVASHLIDPAILVAVAPSYGNRNQELTPTTTTTQPIRRRGRRPSTMPEVGRLGPVGGLDDYYDFLAHQLKPYIDSHYRTLTDPAHTGVAGCSFGGLASVYMGYRHPETFGMAGCMSPSLWWDNQTLVDQIESDTAPKSATRFWFIVGANEGEAMWQPTMRAAAALKRRGWVEGKDVALYLDYTGVHANPTWAAQAPSMYQFLLGKQTPALNHIEIKQLHDPAGRPIYLYDVRESPYAALELQFNGGYRLNAIDPQFTSDRPDIFSVDQDAYHALVNKRRGLGLLKASFEGFTAQQVVVGYIPPTTVTYPCPAVKASLDVRAPLTAWPEQTNVLDFSFAHAEQDPSFPPPSATMPTSEKSGRFGVWHDDRFLYVAVSVNKKPLVVDPAGKPWEQDGVELRLDARPDGVRTYGRGEGEMQQIFLLAASPNPGDPDKPTVYQAEKLPAGTLYSCRATEGGFSLQAAIPIAYLNDQQSPAWKAFRLNVVVNTKEDVHGGTSKHWWQPDWRSEGNVPGSGTLVRVEPATATAPATEPRK